MSTVEMSYIPPDTCQIALKSLFRESLCMFVCFFVCFVALRPKSTAMVMAGQSVHLTTPFPGHA